MNIIELIIHNNFFVLFSVALYFNEKILYSKIEKHWIKINNKHLIWNHRYAELKHVLNNIKLISKHNDKPPKNIYYQDKLSNLITVNCTKYEKFTSDIVNNILKKNITKILIIHCKNIRGNIKDDVPLISLQMIEKTKQQDIYQLSESVELTDISDILLNFDKNTSIISFSDWRGLYRNGYSLSHANFLFLNKYIKNILKLLDMNIGFFFITITSDMMYAITYI